MEQFINVNEKELVPLLSKKRFKTLKEAATWADDQVLAHQPVPRWIGSMSDGASESLSGGTPSASLSGSPHFSSGTGNKPGQFSPVRNVSTQLSTKSDWEHAIQHSQVQHIIHVSLLQEYWVF